MVNTKQFKTPEEFEHYRVLKRNRQKSYKIKKLNKEQRKINEYER